MEDRLSVSLQERTNDKLRFARVHLNELKSQGHPSGNDFDRAHQESFLFHLFGTRDAFLSELNHYYHADVPTDGLTLGKIRSALTAQNKTSPEIRKFYELEQDQSSWFSRAKAMRDHSTHMHGVKRAYFAGGVNHQKVKLRHPDTGNLDERHFVLEFEDWLNQMELLIQSLRKSAMEECSRVP